MKFQKLLRTLLPICALSLMSFDSPQEPQLECPKCHSTGGIEIVVTPKGLYAICGSCHTAWIYVL